MTGYIRLFLATLVLLSHTGVRIYGYNEGVFAVVVFYILAGHVTQRLVNKLVLTYPSRAQIFYYYIFDRILRIFPTYIIVSLLTILFLLASKYGDPYFNITNLILNFTIIPLNYYMFILHKIEVLRELHWWLIPPAWSLGAEVQAYILLAALLLMNNRFILILSFVLSTIIYFIANLGIIHSDYYGYRLLPGVFFFFLSGAIVEKLESSVVNKSKYPETHILGATYFLALVWLVVNFFFLKFRGAYTLETLLGYLIGIPLLIFLIKIKTKHQTVGNYISGLLSYSLFLIHYPVIWFFSFFQVPPNPLLILGVSMLLSFLLLPVDALLFTFRKKLFNFRS
jgi:peptidoglycan/LPS O-acetylase OafA/YrhL